MAKDSEVLRKWSKPERGAEGPCGCYLYYARGLILGAGDWRRLHGCSVTTEQ